MLFRSDIRERRKHVTCQVGACVTDLTNRIRAERVLGGSLIYRGHLVDKGTAEQGSERGKGGQLQLQ